MMIKKYIFLIIKGLAMGTANVIPGVSGGTVALITGIFEKLIDSLKSIDIKAFRLLFQGKFREFEAHINFFFLLAVFSGVGISIFSLAQLLDFLFTNYETFTWAYFFGLIAASVYYVGKMVDKWTWRVTAFFIVGTVLALTISMLNPATENHNFFYLILCGAVAVCSMILPGLSGSFVLILMGNYKLIFIEAVNNLDFMILLPVVIGAGFGLLLFSHFLAWIFNKFHNETIAVLAGFILGSLGILWPWKNKIYMLTTNGHEMRNSKGETIIEGYQRYFPTELNTEVVIALLLVLAGFVSIWLMERLASTNKEV